MMLQKSWVDRGAVATLLLGLVLGGGYAAKKAYDRRRMSKQGVPPRH